MEDTAGFGIGPGSEKLATAKAISEAAELDAAIWATPAPLVCCQSSQLEGHYVAPARICLDRAQARARSAGSVDPAPDRSRHWVLGREIVTQRPVWLPSDAVLMSKRFLDRGILPSSTGLGCAAAWLPAVRHAVFEVLEKAVLPGPNDFTSPCGSTLPNTAAGRAVACIAERAGVQAVASVCCVGPLAFCRAVDKDSGIWSTCVRESRHGAVLGAVEELMMKTLGAAADKAECRRPPGVVALSDRVSAGEGGLDTLLEELGVGLALVALRPPHAYVTLNAVCVVKAVAYTLS
jgi:hypothetical protein